MTLYQEHALITIVADIFRGLSENVHQDAENGLKLKGFDWLTPSQCYLLRTIIEEHNNRYYGDWDLDREFCERLKIGEHSA